MATINPRKWRYTYESQSHIPILKLYLFSTNFNPITQCNNLTLNLIFEKSILNVTWNNRNSPMNLVSLVVPLPKVLVDLESPLNFKACDDYIEVKIALLLPVDHPIVNSFVSELSCCGGFGGGDKEEGVEFFEPLSMNSDFKELSSKGAVEFYCRSCDFKLTKCSVRCLVDLPSVNWTDVADNWFGSCCCSFGSISEELVGKYVRLYKCSEGSCLLTSTSVILCKDDVTGFETRAQTHNGKCDDKLIHNSTCKPESDACINAPCSTESSTLNVSSMQFKSEEQSLNEPHRLPDVKPYFASSEVDTAKDTESEHHCCTHDDPKSLSKDDEFNGSMDLQDEQKSFLNCYLGDAFLFKPSGLSKNIEWIDFACPQCSHILGAYPSVDGSEPLDGGIRLLKCYISISAPSDGRDELFRKYTLERMFTCQLLESAKDELSFRTVVKDLKTKSSMLNMILVNPNSWCCSGWCSEDAPEQYPKINLHPVVKVLFSHCYGNVKSEVSLSKDWEKKHQANEVFMLKHVVSELTKSMERAKDSFPPSFSSTHGFFLSSIPR